MLLQIEYVDETGGKGVLMVAECPSLLKSVPVRHIPAVFPARNQVFGHDALKRERALVKVLGCRSIESIAVIEIFIATRQRVALVESITDVPGHALPRHLAGDNGNPVA